MKPLAPRLTLTHRPLPPLPKLKEEGCAFAADLEDLSVDDLMDDFGMKKMQAKRLVKHFSK